MNKVQLSIDLLLLRNNFDKSSAEYQLLNNAGYEINAADTEINEQKIEIRILKQQIEDLKNKLFESTIVQPCDRADDRFYPEEELNNILNQSKPMDNWERKAAAESLWAEFEEESSGTKVAREIRIVCNKLSNEEREIYLNKALDIIYKDCPEQDTRKNETNI